MKPSFFGKCYGCGKKDEIVACISWASQKDQHGRFVCGGFRNFCSPCEKSFGIGVNRKITAKKLSDLSPKANLSEYKKKCSKCRKYFPESKSKKSVCLICYGRSRDGAN